LRYPDYINIPMDDELKIKNNMTISFWVKLPVNEEVYQQRAILTALKETEFTK